MYACMWRVKNSKYCIFFNGYKMDSVGVVVVVVVGSCVSSFFFFNIYDLCFCGYYHHSHTLFENEEIKNLTLKNPETIASFAINQLA